MNRTSSIDSTPSETKCAALLCEAAKSQLVVIDIQAKLGATIPVKVLNRVIDNTVLLLEAGKTLGIPVLASEQYPKGLGPLDPRIIEHLPSGVQRFEKTSFSCVQANGFLDALRNAARPQVVLAGMEAHVCILQTAIDLSAQGFEVFVAEDALCSRKLENYQNALARMQQSGVVVLSAESVVFEWLRDAQHEHFKAIAKLLR
ncbi:MAG: isochorismatase family protein [Gammaproteobacteria bacterium]